MVSDAGRSRSNQPLGHGLGNELQPLRSEAVSDQEIAVCALCCTRDKIVGMHDPARDPDRLSWATWFALAGGGLGALVWGLRPSVPNDTQEVLSFVLGGGFAGAAVGWISALRRSGSSFWSDPSVIASCLILALPAAVLSLVIAAFLTQSAVVFGTAAGASLIRQLVRWINRRDDPRSVGIPDDAS